MSNIQQTENKAFIIGVLKEHNIEFRPSKTSNRLMAIGTLTVVMNTPEGTGEVKVRVQQFAVKKDGTENSLFKGLQTISNTYKSIKTHGDEADTIKIEGSLEDGTYYSTNKNDYVNKLDLKGVFVNRVEDKTIPHCCKVGFGGYISKVTPLGEELEVEIVGIGYGGVGIPVTGLIPKDLVGAFQARYNVGCTTTLNFNIINEVHTQEVQTEVGFGESLGEIIERHITKRVIFGGGAIKYAGTQGALKEEEVRQALALRQVELEKKKTDAIAKDNGGNMPTGFGGASMGAGAQMGANTITTGSMPNFGVPANFGGM